MPEGSDVPATGSIRSETWSPGQRQGPALCRVPRSRGCRSWSVWGLQILGWCSWSVAGSPGPGGIPIFVWGPQVLGGGSLVSVGFLCSERGPGLCGVPRSLGGSWSVQGPWVLGVGGGLCLVGSESSRKLAHKERELGRALSGSLGLCYGPVCGSLVNTDACPPGLVAQTTG